MPDESNGNENGIGTWRFLSNHAQVLICIMREPNPGSAIHR